MSVCPFAAGDAGGGVAARRQASDLKELDDARLLPDRLKRDLGSGVTWRKQTSASLLISNGPSIFGSDLKRFPS